MVPLFTPLSGSEGMMLLSDELVGPRRFCLPDRFPYQCLVLRDHQAFIQIPPICKSTL